jgi:hypothetical protein
MNSATDTQRWLTLPENTDFLSEGQSYYDDRQNQLEAWFDWVDRVAMQMDVPAQTPRDVSFDNAVLVAIDTIKQAAPVKRKKKKRDSDAPKPESKVVNIAQMQEMRTLLAAFTERHNILDDRVKFIVENVDSLDMWIEYYSDTDRFERRYHVQKGYPTLDGKPTYCVLDKDVPGFEHGRNAAITNPTIKTSYLDKAEAKAKVDRLNQQHEENPKRYEVQWVWIDRFKILDKVAWQWASDEVYTSLQVAYDEECRLNSLVKEGK